MFLLDFTRHSEWASHEESHRVYAPSDWVPRRFLTSRAYTRWDSSSFLVRMTPYGLLAMTRRTKQKLHILYIFILLSNILSAQSWMRPPIDSPLYLSGNLCALRGGHFHYGIDLPTNNTEGWPIRAVADGYVSRVNISPYGYGNALFITHYNGYTTVYAHLSKYETNIYNYILAQHYKRQSFSLDVFPTKNLLKVKKGDIIAYSGNSGGSTGPHLHFEVRDASNLLVNPQLFLDIPDTAKPVVQNVYIVYDDGRKIQLKTDDMESEMHDGNEYKICKIEEGNFYIEAEIFDRQFFYENKLSPTEVSMSQNGKLKYHSTLNSFGFHHDKYINLHTDHQFLWDSGRYLHKLYIDKNNFAPFYNRSLGNGKMHTKSGEEQYIQIEVVDAKGNAHKSYIKFVGVMLKPSRTPQSYYNVFPDSSAELHDTRNGVVLKIDKGAVDFPNSLYIKYADEGILLLSSGEILISGDNDQFVPFLKPASFSVPMPSIRSDVPKSKLLLAEITKEYIVLPIQTKIENNKITGIIYHTGTYKIILDIYKPTIEFVSDSNNQIIYKISDELSGISSYRMQINGKWVLAKYDVKAGKLIYDKDIYLPKAAQYIISVSVCDNKENCNYVTNTIRAF